MSDAPERIWAFYAPHIAEDENGATIVAHETVQYGAAEYVRANTIPAAQPTVKPLVWFEKADGGETCLTDERYSISYWEREKLFVDRYTTMRRHPTLEAAKAAAQADYEARILSVLDMQPTVSPELLATTHDVAALEKILSERGAVFDAMVDAAEDAAGKDVSFNVVIGRALRAALARVKG